MPIPVRRGGEEFPFDPTSVEESLRQAPEDFRSQLSKGFRALLSIPPDRVEQVLIAVARSYPQPPNRAELSRILETDQPHLLRAAVALAIFMVSAQSTSPDEFFTAISSTNILTDEEAQRAKGIVKPAYEKQEAQIKLHLAEEMVASRVLPNLNNILWAVDLRSRYERDKLTALIPVVVVDFSTDISEKSLHCQLSQAEVENLLRTFERIKKRMEELRQKALELRL